MKQRGETAKAYAAFCIYRDLGPKRTVRKAYNDAHPKRDPRKGISSHWPKWSMNNEWVRRCNAFDQHKYDKMMAGRTSIIEGARQRYLDKLQELVDRQLEMAFGELPEAGKIEAWMLTDILDRAGLTKIKPDSTMKVSSEDGPVTITVKIGGKGGEDGGSTET